MLCERRHEVKGKFGDIVTRGIFPTTVEQILDLDGHIRVVRDTLEPIPKTVTVIVYVTGCQPLLQAFYVWLNNASRQSILPRIILAHYNKKTESFGIFVQIMVMKYTFRNLLADFGSSPGAGTSYLSSPFLILMVIFSQITLIPELSNWYMVCRVSKR